MSDAKTATFPVWDPTTRWFHWINVLAVLVLALSGFLFMFRNDLAIHGVDAKMALMALHAWVGYVFALNLLIRLIWGFFGNRFARWNSVLPTRVTLTLLRRDLSQLLARKPHVYLGLSPLGRVAVTTMFALLVVMATTGLIRAGTDLYYPPLGPIVTRYIAAPGVEPSEINWRNAKELANEQQLHAVKTTKFVAGITHHYSAYVLLLFVALHITGVALTETRQRSGVVSAMISGHKAFAGKPVDLGPDEGERQSSQARSPR